MIYRVYLADQLLKNVPLEIKKIQSNFTRDLTTPGVYVQEVLNIIFVGDGYCKLKETQEALEDCKVNVRIEVACKNIFKTIFIGIIDTSTIELDHTLGQAKAKITDDSIISRILENKESLYNPSSLTSINNIPISAVSVIDIDILDVEGSGTYPDIEVYETMELLQGLLDWLTDNSVTVQSDFFNQEYLVETLPETDAPTNQYRQTYEVTYGSTPGITATTVIKYKDFYGNLIERTITGIGSLGSHVANVWRSLLKTTSALTNIAEKKDFLYKYDFDTFFSDGSDNGTDMFKLHSYFPFEILSIENDEATVSWNLSENPDYTFIDSGNNTCFLNGSMLRGNGHDNFYITFKDIIDDLNKMYNIVFSVINGVFRIENEKYYRNSATISYTFDSIKELKSKPSLDSVYSKFTTGDKGTEIDLFIKRDFISQFCNLDNDFDAEPKAIRSAASIWNDLDNPDENNDKNLYCVLGNSNVSPPTRTEGYMLCGFTGGALGTVEFVYAPNLYICNNEQLIRHFPKFLDNLSVSPYVMVVNTDPSNVPYEYTFTEIIDQQTYQYLINNNLNKISFKQLGSVDTYEGIIQEIKYEYESGKAEFTVWGRKV